MKIRLAEHRQRLRLSQEEMAERLDASISQISRWETGRTNIPSNRLSDVAVAYECNVAEIFDFDDDTVILTEDLVIEMVRNAQEEMPVGTSYANWAAVVGSSVFVQLKLIQAVGGFKIARDTEKLDISTDTRGRLKRRWKRAPANER